MESSLSSPLRISNRGNPRKTFPGDHGNTDVGFDHFSGQTKSLEGELVGVRNWSGTSRKENAPVFAPINEKSREICRHNDDEVEKNYAGQKVYSIKILNNSYRVDNKFRCEGYEASLEKMDDVVPKDCNSASRHNVLQNCSSSRSLDIIGFLILW